MAAPRQFPVVSFIIALMGIIVLCGLGTWQIQRLSWKNDLQHQLDAAFAQNPPPAFTAEQVETLQKGHIIRGQVKGKADFTKAIAVEGRIIDGKSAAAIVVPFTFFVTPKNAVSLPVEIGCAVKPDIEKIKTIRARTTTVTGLLRVPSWSFVTPENNLQKNQWWRLDTTQLQSVWNMPIIADRFITVENTKDNVTELVPCPIEKTLRNDHLSYAFFWFSMASALAVIWGLRFLRPYLQSA